MHYDDMTLEELLLALFGELAMLAALSLALEARTVLDPCRMTAEGAGRTRP